MSKKSLRRDLTLVGATVGVLGIGAGLGAAVYAQMAPQSKWPLYYSGALEADGKPAEGKYSITVEIFDVPSGADPICKVANKEAFVSAGRFRIDVSECAEKIAKAPTAFVGVSYIGPDAVPRTIPERTQVGAVPWALEARHAVTADDPAVGGAIEKRLAKQEIKSGFRAKRVSNPDVPVGWTELRFSVEDFDFNDEYAPATGRFVPKQAGTYLVTCQTGSGVSEPLSGWAGIYVNGVEYQSAGYDETSASSNRTATALMKLPAGAFVTCHAYSSKALSLQNLDARLSFSAILVAAE